MFVQEDFPQPSLNTPASLQALVNGSLVEIITNTAGLRQAKAPSALVDIQTVANGYRVDYFAAWGAKDTGTGLYPPIGSPFNSWTVDKPSSSPFTIRVFKTGVRTNTYVWTAGTWTMTCPDGTVQTCSYVTNAAGQILTNTMYYQQYGGAQVCKDVMICQALSNQVAPAVALYTLGQGADIVTNCYIYNTAVSTNDTNYGKLILAMSKDGGWERYEYNTNGLLSKTISAFLNGATNAPENSSRVTEYYYAPVHPSDDGTIDSQSPRTTIEKLKGYEVARRYLVVLTNEVRDIVCVHTNAPWNAPSNLVTVRREWMLTNGLARSVQRPDGTAEITLAVTNVTGLYKTNTILSGRPDASVSTIIDGTQDTTVLELNGRTLSHTVRDIVSGIVVAQELFSDFDTYHRARRTDFLDGTYTYTTYNDCCGQSSFRDRDGVMTDYTYDSLNRLLTTKRLGITTSNVYDAAGSVLETWRFGSNGAPIRINASTYDMARRLKTSTDALNNMTSYAYSFEAAGRSFTTTTQPDLTTRIDYRNRDGSASEVAGTGVLPMTYDYDIEVQDGFARPFAKEIRVPMSQWTKTYTDMAGRNYKTVFAAASAPYPYQQSFYNTNGQAVRQIFFETTTNVSAYNANGELEYTAIDMDANGQIGLAGADRVTRRLSQVLADGGVNVRRTTSYSWPSNNVDASMVSQIEQTSVDGLRTWQVSFGRTNRSQTLYATGNYRYVTNIAFDGAYTVLTHLNGRMVAENRFGADGTSLGGTTYGYDTQGRTLTQTDLRTATVTTFLYNNADQVVTNKVEPPGLPAQVTVNFYDNMGRVWRTQLPDGGNVTNEYTLRGELRKRSGSRTYPVQYTYDSQGRMTNMTTWQDAATGAGAAATSWNYDGYRGFLVSKQYADNTGPTYTYDGAGRMLTRQWARGVTTTYAYSPAGELKSVDYSDTTPDVTYALDRLGRPTTVTQGTQSTALLQYDDAGNLLSERYTAGLLTGLTVSNRYDPLLRRTTNGLWNGSSWLTQARYTYDAAGRLGSVGDGANAVAYNYLANSPLLAQLTYTSNGVTRLITSKSYDNANRLSGILSSNGVAGAVSSHAYQYNLANQRTRRTDADASYWNYTYDALG